MSKRTKFLADLRENAKNARKDPRPQSVPDSPCPDSDDSDNEGLSKQDREVCFDRFNQSVFKDDQTQRPHPSETSASDPELNKANHTRSRGGHKTVTGKRINPCAPRDTTCNETVAVNTATEDVELTAVQSKVHTNHAQTSKLGQSKPCSRRLFPSDESESDNVGDLFSDLPPGEYNLECYPLPGEDFNPIDGMFVEELEEVNPGTNNNCVLQESISEENSENDSRETPKRTREYTPPEKLTRKRKRNPAAWKSTIAKDLLNKGEEHYNTKGKLIKARGIEPPCDESCRMKCSTNISETDRQEIFKGFWAISSHQHKWDFITNNIEQVEIKRRTKVSDDSESRRKNSRKYSFTLSGKKTYVCKTMFLATLNICDGWVSTSFKKKNKNAIGEISPDKRGKNRPPPKEVNENRKKSVREHIESLPRMPSHYTRATSSKDYLVQEITSVADMHELYGKWMDEHHPGDDKATYRQYTDIFNFEFNISFFISKKDMCDTCVGYENAKEEEKDSLKEEYDLHLLNADLAQTMRMADTKVAQLKSSKTLCVANFDYQKTLICPKAKASVFYYKRKLSVSNFTIVDSGLQHDVCYCYDETVAAKGSNEVASFVFHFISEKVKAGVSDFRFYSDNCTGQNKNRGVVSMYLHAAAKYKVIIRHRFLEKGHTWNAADNVHSVIERKISPHDIYSPEEYYEKIAKAKRKAEPIKVIKVDQKIVYDWKSDLAPKLNLDKDANGKAIPWTKLREITVNGSNEHELSFKANYNDEAVLVSTRGVGRPVNLEKYEPKNVYHGPLPIAKAKYNDLVYYCNNKLIPSHLHAYFKSLPHSNNVDEEVETVDEVIQADRGRARKRRAPVKKSQKRQKKRTVEDDPDDPLIALEDEEF